MLAADTTVAQGAVVDDWTARARAAQGVVPSADLGPRPARAAARHGLVPLQPRVRVACTQPITPEVLVAAVAQSVTGPYALVGPTALWWHGVAPAPDVVHVGVPHGTRFRALPPLRVHRLAPSVLRGRRTVRGVEVVALEVAVLQSCAGTPAAEARRLLEVVLRERRTTVPRLRARCRRGLAGSAAVRAGIDELAGTSLDAAVRRLAAALALRGVHGLRTEVRFVSAGGASAYADLLDEASRTVIEVDGYLSHVERQRFLADRRRDRWLLAQHELHTVRVDVQETLDGLDALADELAALLLSRRSVRLAG